jgi:hypothetical protein
MGNGNSLNVSAVNMVGKYVVDEETKQAARKTVCHWATDSKEAIEFMKMLGIHPSQGDSELDGSEFLPYHEVASNSTPPRKLQS